MKIYLKFLIIVIFAFVFGFLTSLKINDGTSILLMTFAGAYLGDFITYEGKG